MASVGMNDRLFDLRHGQLIHSGSTRLNGVGSSDYYPWEDQLASQQSSSNGFTTEYSPADSLLASKQSNGNASSVPLQKFFSMVEEVQEYIFLISQKNKEIAEVQNLIISKPASAISEHRKRHSQLMEEVKECSKRAFSKLQKIDDDIKLSAQYIAGHHAMLRIKKAQFASLSHQLKEAMLEFNGREDSYRDRCKSIIKRQMQAVQPEKEVSDDNVDEILDTQFVLMPTSAVASKMQTLDEVEARKLEILALERNIMELHDMFYNMMILVEEQGDLIDHIGFVVEDTKAYTEEGAAKIMQAAKYKKSSRKLRVCLLLILLLTVLVVITVILVVVLVVVFKLFPPGGNNSGGNNPGGSSLPISTSNTV